jgi:asparagine synthase (glutamine-hydrolysing)
MMCGIAGYYSASRDVVGTEEIIGMTRALARRGPDDEGIALIAPEIEVSRHLVTDATAPGVEGEEPIESAADWPHRIALGHRRFSIIDLSPAAHQPFRTSDGSICLAFNGEIYNYVELRRELEGLGHSFGTTSDTEVLAEAYLEWGTEAFSRFCGFWALALYDARRRGLLLARDRIGKAPLYIARSRGRLWWSSEITSLITGAGPTVASVNDKAIANFVVRNWRDVHDQTFYRDITTFPRASFAWVDKDGSLKATRFWSLPITRLDESEISEKEAATQLRDHLAEALRIRLRADVPVGFELSGGMDSSALLAIAASRGSKLRAFTMGYPGQDADEVAYARKAWERYKANVEFTISEQRLEDFFQRADYMVGRMGEPFHSPVLLSNQQIWADMKTRGIRVSINGAAGDELLAGYAGVYFIPYLWTLLSSRRVRRFHYEATSFSERPADPFSRGYFIRALKAVNSGLQTAGLRRLAFASARAHRRALDAGLTSLLEPDFRPVVGLEELLREEMTDWRMNYWMRSGNQSFMSLPIEVRFPFLDHRVVEFAFSLPPGYLIRDGWMKWILRRATEDILPSETTRRAIKVGFPFPLGPWLQESKAQFFSIMRGTEIPAIDLNRFEEAYDHVSQADPALAWRIMSVSLWWKKCVLGEQLQGNTSKTQIAAPAAQQSVTLGR